MKIKKEYALLSVYDKDGLETLARALVENGYHLLATGKTEEYLRKNEISVEKLESLIDQGELCSGRVKTLHTKILGGILYRPGIDDASWPFDYRISAVVCNFYPFREKALEIENMPELMDWVDIGGPTMVRAAAKNYENVFCFTNQNQYVRYIASQKENHLALRERLSLEAFDKVAEVDEQIRSEIHFRISKKAGSALLESEIKYGENPHQKAFFYPNAKAALRLTGEMSFNNLRDAENAFRFVSEFDGPACAIVKHQNLCGASVGLMGAQEDEVFRWAWEGDAVSRYGGVVACNFVPSQKIFADILATKFLEVLVIPKQPKSSDLVSQLHKVKPNLRILETEAFRLPKRMRLPREKFVGVFGTLEQDKDSLEENCGPFEKFGEWVVACSKSNAMALVGKSADEKVFFLAGVGQGQPNRLEALKLLAIPRAASFCDRMEFEMENLVCFSDGFLPFEDNIDALYHVGIQKVFAPGGSKNDEKVLARAKELGIEVSKLTRRHFWH